ncbi:unnamed protein product, partial [marine sediment metagenome]
CSSVSPCSESLAGGKRGLSTAVDAQKLCKVLHIPEAITWLEYRLEYRLECYWKFAGALPELCQGFARELPQNCQKNTAF